MKPAIITVPIRKSDESAITTAQDLVAVEEPLQIRLNGHDLVITMRTPGHDRELAAGFLFAEGVLNRRSQIESVEVDERGTVAFTTAPDVEIDPGSFARNFYATSSCGVCGKASVDALKAVGCKFMASDSPTIDATIIPSLPDKLRGTQHIFERTGGLHAAGLFTARGELVDVREDVGRHNAVDKLIGSAFWEDKLPLSEHILMLSGRVSFELIQKALMAGIPAVAAVGAPSSLAVETALRFGMTVIGFLRGRTFNVYTGESRLRHV